MYRQRNSEYLKFSNNVVIKLSLYCLLILLISGVDANGANSLGDKRMNSDLYVFQIARGGLVNNGGLAIKICENIIEDLYGSDQLQRQRPFSVRDAGKYWEVIGSRRPVASGDYGAARVDISKADGQILDIELPKVLSYPKR